MTTPYERIAHARSRLVHAGIPDYDAALDAEVLARHALGWNRAALLSRGREPAPQGFSERFDALVLRRVRREPVAYIVGHREFWGLEFEVTRDVLVPRPETEIIVEEVVAFARANGSRQVIDVGAGSGCIAIAVAHELRGVHVVATDTSAAALAVASRNAARHGVSDRVSFVRTDLLHGLGANADVILSNPPYIPDRDAATLPPEVAAYEPSSALFGGDDGLDVVRRLLHESPKALAPGGRLVIEFGVDQEQGVRTAAAAAGWNVVTVRADLQRIPRTIVLSRSE